MGTACSSIDKGTVEKRGKYPAAVASGIRCQTLKRCLPGDTISAKQAQPRSQLLKGRTVRLQSGESTDSTRAPTEASIDAHAASTAEVPSGVQKPKVDMLRLEKNLKKMRRVALDVVGQLNHFQVWAKQHFNTLEECFETLVGDTKTQQVELRTFLYNAEIQGFKGRADKVFYGLCDEHSWSEGLVITRAAFLKRLASMGVPFQMVIRQVIATNTKKIRQRLAKKRSSMLSQADVDLLVSFRNFIKPIAKSPEKIFDVIAGDDGCVDEEEFVGWLSSRGFSGDAQKVFYCFCDPAGVISRMAFSEMLVTCEKFKSAGDEDPETNEDDVKEMRDVSEAAGATEKKGLRRAGTVSLPSGSTQRAAQGKSNGEQAKTPKNFGLTKRSPSALDSAAAEGSRVRSKSAPPTSGDAETGDISKGIESPPKNRRRSNSMTLLDGNPVTAIAGKDALPSEKNRPRANGGKVALPSPKGTRRSNSAKSLDCDPVATDAGKDEDLVHTPDMESSKPKRKVSAKAQPSKSSSLRRAQSKFEMEVASRTPDGKEEKPPEKYLKQRRKSV